MAKNKHVNTMLFSDDISLHAIKKIGSLWFMPYESGHYNLIINDLGFVAIKIYIKYRYNICLSFNHV